MKTTTLGELIQEIVIVGAANRNTAVVYSFTVQTNRSSSSRDTPAPKIICNLHADKSLYNYPNNVNYKRQANKYPGPSGYRDRRSSFRTCPCCALSPRVIDKPGLNAWVDISTSKVTFRLCVDCHHTPQLLRCSTRAVGDAVRPVPRLPTEGTKLWNSHIAPGG